jgi:hypothetical protein
VLSRWLRGARAVPLLHLRGLHRVTVRFRDGMADADFARQLATALRPAPELRTIASHIATKLHGHGVHVAGRELGGPRGRRRQRASAGAAFNCVHARGGQVRVRVRVRVTLALALTLTLTLAAVGRGRTARTVRRAAPAGDHPRRDGG